VPGPAQRKTTALEKLTVPCCTNIESTLGREGFLEIFFFRIFIRVY
jgi:hypothetical protein